MNRLDICVSDRCFFPKSAFMSSKAVVKLAKGLGYEHVEFHPTWAVWWETLTKGKLSCRVDDIASFHISWREDGKYGKLGFIKRNFFFLPFWIFPPEPLGTKTLQKLVKKYKKQVVVHWQDDFDCYPFPLYELLKTLGISRAQIEKEVKKGRIKGIVLDTRKFAGWLRTTRETEGQSLRELLPYIKEVHFRLRYKEGVQAVSGNKETETTRLMKKLIKMGYKGRVVVEVGWPDQGPIEVLRQEGLEKVHQKIIKFLVNL